MSQKELAKRYDSKSIENKWYSHWEEKGFFKPQEEASGDPYVIVIPPPNVTGILHMGHALNNSMQDILVRWNRMQGKDVLWLPGTDHASIATEAKVTKMLKDQGIDKRSIGREEFLKHAWEWKEKYGGTIVGQLRRLGCSVDWSRERFTMDDEYTHAVLSVFVKLYEKGLIYRGERIIHWDPVGQTALSDEEVIYKEVNGKLWHFKYPIKDSDDFVIVATTRPETMLGDTGVAVNPEDERYQHLIGKKVVLPLVGREIPIFADAYVDKEFGTGCVKVTPAHDPNDFAMGQRHSLEEINIMHPNATLNENAPEKYQGMDRYAVRKAVVADLEEAGLLEKIETHLHKVGHSERTDAVVEPYLSKQWFVKMEELAKPGLEAVKKGEVKFHPEKWVNTYNHWMENIRDWCISRQLWWGHRVPVWYRGEEIYCGLEVPEGEGWEQDPDVLDTWFSSWLWPFATLGWPEETEDVKRFYPTADLVTGPDIIFFWVARMIMAGYQFMDKAPFSNVIIHGIVRAEGGAKMSKSLGNSIDPLEVIEEMGADALRFSMIMLSAQDVYLSREKFEVGRNFINKLWNASRFVFMNLEGFKKGNLELDIQESDLSLSDRWILSRLDKTIEAIDKHLKQFELSQACSELYHFVWDDFCDWYIELSKPALNGEDAAERERVQKILFYVLENTLRLLHPFAPFVSEELWQALKEYAEDADSFQESIMLAAWPKEAGKVDEKTEGHFSDLQKAVSGIRDLRARFNIAPQQKLNAIVVVEDTELSDVFEKFQLPLEKLAKVSLKIEKEFEKDTSYVGNSYPRFEVLLSIEGVVDLEQEKIRIEEKIKESKNWILSIEKKLSNENFVSNAPEAVVAKERRKLEDAQKLLKSNEELLTLFS